MCGEELLPYARGAQAPVALGIGHGTVNSSIGIEKTTGIIFADVNCHAITSFYSLLDNCRNQEDV